jgi:hypothetical protein
MWMHYRQHCSHSECLRSFHGVLKRAASSCDIHVRTDFALKLWDLDGKK